jgi:hypothetical protein
MPALPRELTSPRVQAVIIGLAAAILAIAGFQTGRYTVDAAAVSNKTATIPSQPLSEVASRKDALVERQQDRIIIREIATVPFSELYDVLKSASREQLLAWARDLERMPRGPRQRAAVTAYYKSLIQVDHRAAIDAILRAQNLPMRDVAISAVMAATPESLWADLNGMLDKLPHPRRGSFPQDLIWNWSRVDPVAVGKYYDKHPVEGEGENSGLYQLLFNWGKIDTAAAKEWLESDASHQKKEAFRAFVVAWAEADRGAAINYAIANASRSEFEPAVKDLSYYLLRLFPDDARTFVLLLPPEQARVAMEEIAHKTTGVILHAEPGYQRPPDVVARWMSALPLDLWRDEIGAVVSAWMTEDAAAAIIWLNQLQPDARDAALADLCRSRWTDTAEETLPLGFTIRDQRLRDQVLGEFARKFGDTRDEAIAGVSNLNIPAAQKKYLIRIMPEARRER